MSSRFWADGRSRCPPANTRSPFTTAPGTRPERRKPGRTGANNSGRHGPGLCQRVSRRVRYGRQDRTGTGRPRRGRIRSRIGRPLSRAGFAGLHSRKLPGDRSEIDGEREALQGEGNDGGGRCRAQDPGHDGLDALRGTAGRRPHPHHAGRAGAASGRSGGARGRGRRQGWREDPGDLHRLDVIGSGCGRDRRRRRADGRLRGQGSDHGRKRGG